MHTYLVQLGGVIDVEELNPHSPLRMTLMDPETAGIAPSVTWISICTDQSGLIGLIRYLHGRGLELLSIVRDR